MMKRRGVTPLLTYLLFLVSQMKKSVPSLSTRGFVDGVVDRVDRLLSYFLIANYSQTELYYSKITSLAYLVKLYGAEPRQLTANVQSTLTNQFMRYFEGCLVECEFSYLNPAAASGAYQIRITITAIDENGVRVNIASELNIIEGTFKEIARRNNEEST